MRSYRSGSGADGYDSLNRLMYVRYYKKGQGGTEAQDETQLYMYDNVGNRTYKQATVVGGFLRGESYGYNGANILTQRKFNNETTWTQISWDMDGNTTADLRNTRARTTDGQGTEATRSMVWDSQNRMTSCTFNGVTSDFQYGPDGLRRLETTGGVTTHYALDGQSMVQESKPDSSTGTILATYMTGNSGPIYRLEEHKNNLGTLISSTFRWYVYDGLGSVIAELNQDGTMDSTTVERQYDVFGQVRRDAGGASTSKHKFVGGLGHQSEAETGLVYMCARYMDPETGRFVSEDPGRAGSNWYVYCNNDPVNQIDNDGKLSLEANFLIVLVLGVICLVTKNPWVILACCIILLAVAILDYVQSRNSGVDAGRKPIDPWVRQIQKGYEWNKPDGAFMGGVMEVIGVCYAEQLIIGVLCEDGDQW